MSGKQVKKRGALIWLLMLLLSASLQVSHQHHQHPDTISTQLQSAPVSAHQPINHQHHQHPGPSAYVFFNMCFYLNITVRILTLISTNFLLMDEGLRWFLTDRDAIEPWIHFNLSKRSRRYLRSTFSFEFHLSGQTLVLNTIVWIV